jgi:hypothetical protein
VFNRVLSDDELSALAAGWDCFFDRDGDGQDDSEGDCDDKRAELNTLDVDGDGVTSCDDDCDDSDPDIHPGAEEICDDEIDNDCDGDVDETVCDADTADVSQDDSGDPDGKQDPEGQGAGDCGCGAGLHPSPRALLWLSLGFLALRRRDGGPRR